MTKNSHNNCFFEEENFLYRCISFDLSALLASVECDPSEEIDCISSPSFFLVFDRDDDFFLLGIKSIGDRLFLH